MSVASGRGRLEEAQRDLRRDWDRVRHYWDDGVSAKFETEVVVMFDRKINSVVPSLDLINDLLQRVRRDCQ